MTKERKNVPFSLIARRLRALADPTRLHLLHILCDGERNVTELVENTGLPQASVSRHLKVLREEQLVVARRDSKMVFYCLKDKLPREICDRICRSFEQIVNDEKKMIENYWSAVNE